MPPEINSRQLVLDALNGQATPRPPWGPLAVHFCAREAGASLRAYSTRPRLLADCVLRYFEKHRPDAVWISADTWVTAEAMGAAVCSPGEDQPLCGAGEPLIRQTGDLDRIPPADPGAQGRMPVLLEALRLVKERIGEEVFIAGCFDQSPFSLACALVGINELMVKMLDDPPFVRAVMERCIEYGVAYGQAFARCGADLLSTGDSPAGLIGPERYREVALPAERRVFKELKETTGKLLSLHICGDTTRILADMARCGADVLEIDHQMDLRRACRLAGEKIALWGNLNPVGVLLQGDRDTVHRKAREAIEAAREERHARFVLSSGCTLALGTPSENLRALRDAAESW